MSISNNLPRIPTSTTVLVIGGGPAGSTVATLLARNGHSVVLLEREHFPRYHIGESLLPSCLEIFDLLGVREKVEAFGFVRKPGAYLHWGDEQWSLRFGETQGSSTYSFQVKRADFDHLLLKHSQEQGAQVFEGILVETIEFEGGRPARVKWREAGGAGEGGTITCDYLVDASGRTGLIANKYFNNRYSHRSFQNVAKWGYWEGVRKPDDSEPGAICVGSIDRGWLWAIPLQDGTTSVGAVMHRDRVKESKGKPSEEVYLDAIDSCPLVKEMLKGAQLKTKVQTETDYSYAAERFAGPGYFIVGDAACFLDPLLSSGVHLATYSALLAAASISSLLRGEIEESAAIGYFEKSYRHSYLRFLVFVSTFYDQCQGQEGYYREAGHLIRQDCKPQDLKHAFLSLVTGLEDLSNASEGVPQTILGEMATRLRDNLEMRKDKESLVESVSAQNSELKENVRFFNAIEGLSALSSAHAIDGIYISTQPRLRLTRVECDTVVGGQTRDGVLV